MRGVRLRDGDYVVGMSTLTEDNEVLILTENGYGKRTDSSEYPVKGRGGKGIKTANITDKNGPLVALTTVEGDEDVLVITDQGVIIRFDVDSVSQTGRATQGVRLIRLEEGDKVATMAIIEEDEEDEIETSTEELTEE